jgi:hypothetical protein
MLSLLLMELVQSGISSINHICDDIGCHSIKARLILLVSHALPASTFLLRCRIFQTPDGFVASLAYNHQTVSLIVVFMD